MALPISSVTFPIIVIGASAGGVQALLELVRVLPAGFPAAICIVQHIPAYAVSYLPDLLDKAGALPARHPQNREPLRPGTIYVAPPDHHLLLENDHILVMRGPKENHFRPSVDALFRSAAYTHGSRVIGVVLTGYLNDGTSGLWTVQRLGGVAVVQAPEDAYANAMPQSTLEFLKPDYLIVLAELAPLLERLTAQPPPQAASISSEELARINIEISIAKGEDPGDQSLFRYGELTPFVCPSCQGPLVQLVEGKLVRFRCRTGHGFTLSALLAEVAEGVENKLYAAMQSLQETRDLLHRLSAHFARQAESTVASALLAQAEQAQLRAQAVYESIVKHEALDKRWRLATS
jgi:two-component system chemotaxis response regulator CheB